MNCCIVHDNNGTWSWKWCTKRKDIVFNKCKKASRVDRAFIKVTSDIPSIVSAGKRLRFLALLRGTL
jgi:hypothetical protein